MPLSPPPAEPEEPVGPDDAAMSEPWHRRRKTLYILLPLLGLLLIFAVTRFGGGGEAAPPPPAPTTVALPLSRLVVDWDEYVGRFEASRTVELRPQVSGQLVGIHFDDGSVVQKGQLLFSIDPRPFEAALAEAQATRSSAATALALAQSELARANRLIEDQAVSEQEVDSLKAEVQSARARLAGADALIRSRRLDLEFTRIRAPFTGRISDRNVDIGNLVAGDNAGNATVLTTINAVNPIYFSFDGAESLYLKHRRNGEASQRVEIRLRDEAEYDWEGRVDFTDNAIAEGSGTIRSRAVVDNPDNFLVPGMFGQMRLQSGAPAPALLVPDSAVVTDQARKVVYVVGKDGTVAMKPVQIGALSDGLRIIRSGLDKNDRVVIGGIQMVQPGAKVKTVAGRIEPTGEAQDDSGEPNEASGSDASEG